jgi:hypothetical protein
MPASIGTEQQATGFITALLQTAGEDFRAAFRARWALIGCIVHELSAEESAPQEKELDKLLALSQAGMSKAGACLHELFPELFSAHWHPCEEDDERDSNADDDQDSSGTGDSDNDEHEDDLDAAWDHLRSTGQAMDVDDSKSSSDSDMDSFDIDVEQ